MLAFRLTFCLKYRTSLIIDKKRASNSVSNRPLLSKLRPPPSLAPQSSDRASDQVSEFSTSSLTSDLASEFTSKPPTKFRVHQFPSRLPGQVPTYRHRNQHAVCSLRRRLIVNTQSKPTTHRQHAVYADDPSSTRSLHRRTIVIVTLTTCTAAPRLHPQHPPTCRVPLPKGRLISSPTLRFC